MLLFPEIDPVAFSIAGIRFHWYGIMYMIGFFALLVLGQRRARNPDFGMQPQWVGDIIFYSVFGTIIGGRLGYILFYNFDVFLNDWSVVFRIWEGGMSFHGGLIGVLCAVYLFARKHQQSTLRILDFYAPMVPIGLGAGRFGNFINGELWGRPSELPWSMVFPHVDQLPRHPSQLYEMLTEGLLLFIILWLYSQKPKPLGMMSGLFLLLYSVFRFMIEFTRQPDLHIGFIAGEWLTMGQLLSAIFFIAGCILIYFSRQRSRVSL